MFAITGRIQHGLGAATPYLARQLPLIAEEFPEVAACHRGSINIEFDLAVLVLAPDHRTRPIAWLPGQAATEVFDLLRVRLEAPAGAAAVPGWLYIPHGSPHRRTPHVHEVITTQLDLAGVSSCKLTIDRQAIQLRLPQFRAVLVL